MSAKHCFSNDRFLSGRYSFSQAICTIGTGIHQITSLFGLHNKTTDECRIPKTLSNLDVNTSHSVDCLVHCSPVWVITQKGVQVYDTAQLLKRCMRVYSFCFPEVLVYSPFTGSDVPEGGWTCRLSLLPYLQDSNTLAPNGAAKWPAVAWPKFLFVHVCCEYQGCQLVHKSYITH